MDFLGGNDGQDDDQRPNKKSGDEKQPSDADKKDKQPGKRKRPEDLEPEENPKRPKTTQPAVDAIILTDEEIANANIQPVQQTDDSETVSETEDEDPLNLFSTSSANSGLISVKHSLIKPVTQPISAFLGSPGIGSSQLNTFASIIQQPITCAVWNLWDLGGGYGCQHWIKDSRNALLKLLPTELKLINADIFGFLEIKTGHRIIQQIKNAKPKITAYEIGVMTACMFDWYVKKRLVQDKTQPKKTIKEILQEFSKIMWITDDQKCLTDGLMSATEFFDEIIYPMNDTELILKNLIAEVGNYLKKANTSDLRVMYRWIRTKLNGLGVNNSWFQYSDIDLGKSEAYWNGFIRNEVFIDNWANVQTAFENFGAVPEEEAGKEANGIDLLKDALNIFIGTNKHYAPCILPKTVGDGETTGFVYDTTKFIYCCEGKIAVEKKSEGWRFRSAGFIHLKCKPGILNQKSLMIVAWHAPSEGKRGGRQPAYSFVNNEIKNRANIRPCLKNTNVVLLADMNIGQKPVYYEENIIKEAYHCWLPDASIHMKCLTSLKLSGGGGNQWLNPFDKVLLLKENNVELDIKIDNNYEKMSNDRTAEDIRKLSDHSWVKAEIAVKQNQPIATFTQNPLTIMPVPVPTIITPVLPPMTTTTILNPTGALPGQIQPASTGTTQTDTFGDQNDTDMEEDDPTTGTS